ncbi:hypothetical protein JCGZ_17988 [Jatropha curcas]|uniref:Uncharacterized protein n=1 Tax=Jatropha curcas TaxID=180498 RepID=A0A067K3K4_JATCU|nr:hypothetical protein JCGZ_17988 [Jatropha curcas]
MEASHKGKGFLRGKLAKAKSLLSSKKVSPSPFGPTGSMESSAQYRSKVSPSPYTPYSVNFPISQTVQKVSTSQQRRSFIDYGEDENVDMKASTFISNVRERFKLVDSESW